MLEEGTIISEGILSVQFVGVVDVLHECSVSILQVFHTAPSGNHRNDRLKGQPCVLSLGAICHCGACNINAVCAE